MLLVLKIGGLIDNRISNEALAKKITSNTRQVTFHSQQVTAGKSISYARVVAKRDSQLNTAIILVHGAPGSLDAYLKYLTDDTLLSRSNLYAVDRPGYGFSNFGQAESSLAVQAATIVEIIRSLDEERIMLVGHSFGGAVIAKMAMDYPELVDGFISIAGTISAPAEPHNWWRKIVDFGLVRMILPRALIVCNSEMLPLKNELAQMQNGWTRLEMPITILQGSGDGIVSYQNLKNIETLMQGQENVKFVTLEGKGHLILWTSPERMKQEILKLLDRIK